MKIGENRLEPFGETTTSRLSDVVYDGIISLIATGDLRMDSRLPSENDLAERFGVSRPVVREALGRLREDGIIISRQGSGSFVQREPDRSILQLQRIGSLADVQRCFEFRAEFEATAAKIAAEKRTDEDLNLIEQALKALDKCLDSGEPGTTEDQRFHEAIAQATHNQYFIWVQTSLASHIAAGMDITRHLSQMRSPERLRAVQDEHVAILEAIRDRDAQRSGESMFRHISNARRRMFEGV